MAPFQMLSGSSGALQQVWAGCLVGALLMQRGSSHLGGKAERVEIHLGKVPVTPCAVLGKMKEEHGWLVVEMK